MKFKKAIIEQSKDVFKKMKFFPEPKLMYQATENGTNAAETTISYKPSNPDNEELVMQIERYCMLSNFAAAEKLMEKHYDKLTVNDINRLIQFSRQIAGDTVRNIAKKQEKPEYEKFAPRFFRTIQKKLSPR